MVDVEIHDGDTAAARTDGVGGADSDVVDVAEAAPARDGVVSIDARVVTRRPHEAKGVWLVGGAILGWGEHAIDGGDDGAGCAARGAHGADGNNRHAGSWH